VLATRRLVGLGTGAHQMRIATTGDLDRKTDR